MTFPAQHRTKLHCTNPLERLNKEVKRRADVVGIFPNEDSIVRLIGAVLLEQNDEWQIQHRYMQIEAFARSTPLRATCFSALQRRQPDRCSQLATPEFHHLDGRDCCSQELWRGYGYRCYVSGLPVGSRAVTLLDIRTHIDLISGQADEEPIPPSDSRCVIYPSHTVFPREPLEAAGRQIASAATSRGASKRRPYRRTAQAIRVSLFASATASLFRCMR